MPEVLQSFRMPVQSMSPEDQGFRQFAVEDVDGVELPGCIEVHEVRLDGHIIPVSEIHRVPVDTTHTEFKDLELPNFALVEGPRGAPLLLRSLNSNDGKWQKGSVLFVRGEFEGDTPKGDGLDAMKTAELIALANEKGGTFNVAGTKKADVLAFLRSAE